ncbi:zinc-binding dehydrogenase [Caballeronia catudaia]|uniref:Zinc-binding dehydrogenase n=1 Tax=Caballeronia catudaia TaxID=1777136 RepID=A0A158DHF1_9BURK|nr:zinc-binding dehydrogenase [Caballeronia catudaia]
MIAKAMGASNIMTTVSTKMQHEASLRLGANHTINYRSEDFVAKVAGFTQGKGVDVILDIVGSDYVGRNFTAAALDGRILQVSALEGPAKDLNLWPMMTKRLAHLGSTLRSRPNAEKSAIISELERHVWPLIEAGTIKPQIYRTFPLTQARQAHEVLEAGGHIGKLVLTTAAAAEDRSASP